MVCAYAGACEVHAHMRARNGAGNVREAYALWRSRERMGRACTLHAPAAGQNGTRACMHAHARCLHACLTERYEKRMHRACSAKLLRDVRRIWPRLFHNESSTLRTARVPEGDEPSLCDTTVVGSHRYVREAMDVMRMHARCMHGACMHGYRAEWYAWPEWYEQRMHGARRHACMHRKNFSVTPK